jgi:hypothetical protein
LFSGSFADCGGVFAGGAGDVAAGGADDAEELV